MNEERKISKSVRLDRIVWGNKIKPLLLKSSVLVGKDLGKVEAYSS